MSTKIFGHNDDLVEIEGDVRGEINVYDTEVLIICSDGTVLIAEYGKAGIWKLSPLLKGSLFDCVHPCLVESDDNYTDIAQFKDGLKWAYTATEWEKVK